MCSKIILLLSGPIAVGKSSFANNLVENHDFKRIRSSTYLLEKAKLLGLRTEREVLQTLGDNLDNETDYSWVINSVAAPVLEKDPSHKFWLFDAVRKERQVELFREHFESFKVHHLHLIADEMTLESRYSSRAFISDTKKYSQVIMHKNEISARELINIADTVIDIEDNSISQLAVQFLENLRCEE